jgi:hypothetical protein
VEADLGDAPDRVVDRGLVDLAAEREPIIHVEYMNLP